MYKKKMPVSFGTAKPVVLAIEAGTDSQRISTANFCKHFAVTLQIGCSAAAPWLQ